MPVHVSSEIGRLRSVLVHSPGPELLAVTPSNRADYLYDDIIEAESAQREHRRFIAILERFTTVYQVRTLLADVLGTPDSRDLLIRETMDIVPSEPLARDISELDAAALVRMLIEGREEPPGPIAKALPSHTIPAGELCALNVLVGFPYIKPAGPRFSTGRTNMTLGGGGGVCAYQRFSAGASPN